MGETRVKIRVLPLGNGKARASEAVHCVVDTGATLSTLPEAILRRSGVRRQRRIRLTLADGRQIFRYYGEAILVFEDGNRVPTLVLFGGKRDPALLGVVALETGGYTVDPVRGLIRKRSFQQY